MNNKKAKQMILSVAKPCDDDFWPYPHLPWNQHPCAFSGLPQRIMQRDARILRKVERIVGGEAFKDILDYIGECEGGSEYEITLNTGSGSYQEEYFGFIEGAYVDQSCGYSGDDYYGYVWIPITPKRYLRFFYAM